jgi:hypothetical protein
MNDSGRLAAVTGLVVALAGGIAALLIMGRSASGSGFEPLETFLYLWVASPFAVLFGASLHSLRKPGGRQARLAAGITSCLVVALSVFIYADAAFNPHSSTASLVFLFLPFWSLAAVGIVFLLSSVSLRWLSAHRNRGV